MNCPNCGYYNDAGIRAAVKITDEEGHPVWPPTRYDCKRCGHVYEVDEASRWMENRTSLFDKVVRLLHNRYSRHIFNVSHVPRGDMEMIKIEVDGLPGTAFVISSMEQLDGVVFLAQTWLALRARDKS